MLQTMDEIKKAEFSTVGIINGVDNANILSIDSTTPIVTGVDEPEKESEEQKKVEVEEVKEKAEEKPQESAPAENTEEKEKEKEKEGEKKESEFSEPVEKRIGKLTKKWRTAERERDYERAKRLEAEEALTKLKASIPATDKPKREDFEDEDAFLEAFADWKIESKLKSRQEMNAKTESEVNEKQAASEVEQELSIITERGLEKYEDYNKLVFDKDLVLTQGMVETIILSDIAEDILYYLGKNPDISASIGEMSALKAAMEIGKLEEKLVAGTPKPSASSEEKVEQKAAPVKKVTKTPEPIAPVHTTGVVDKDPSTMTPKEYRAWRERNKE